MLKNKKYTRCFFCGRNESLYKKVLIEGDNKKTLPNEFWLCDNCFKIETNKIISPSFFEKFFWIKA